MNADQKRLAREILADAVEKSDPGERAAFIEQACGTDLELRQLVDALVHAHEQAGDFLRQTIVVGEDNLIGEGPGTVIGRYKLLQEIGQGGFGLVFMAEQLEPVQRKVALKIIKAGMDTREVIARFEAERQALALMDHPNIARVLDAGATESGRPYFVMELVKGIKITDYCDQNNLSTQERLNLFIKVCHAVQHAHQKGIIHRDLKPSNVMVTLHDGEAVPKVIDFGIAKATGQRLTDKTLFTRYEQMIGTPAYMSPEQAQMSGLDVDTRTDIYALGVLLYELLTGVTPFDKETLAKVALDEIRRMIRETEPLKPSTRLRTQLVRTRSTASPTRDGDGVESVPSRSGDSQEVRHLIRLIQGDLDWIVMKALEKDRRRRYETANDFAEDIERHLKHEPVVASPPSTVYRARKFVRRHRVGVAITASVTLALLAGLLFALVGFNRARQERDRAVQAEAATKAVLGFFQEKVLAAARPEGYGGGMGRQVTIRAAVDAAEPRVGTSFSNQPVVEAEIRRVLGETYRYLGECKQAIGQQERSRSLLTATLGPRHAETLNSMHYLALAYDAADRWQEAIPLLEEVLKNYTATSGRNDPGTVTAIDALATAYQHAGRVHEALLLFEEALKIEKARRGPADEQPLVAMHNLALAYKDANRPQEALFLLEETLKGLKVAFGPDDPNTFTTMHNVGLAYREVGRAREALPLLEEALKLRRLKLGAHHPHTLMNLRDLANAYGELAYWSNAVEHYQALITAAPTDHDVWYQAGAAAAAAGETGLSHTFSDGMVARFGTNRNQRICQLLARTLVLVPGSPTNLGLALELTDVLLADNPEVLGNQTTKGIVEYRFGHWREAAKWLDPPWKRREACLPGYFLAMAWHQLGDTAAARRILDQANQRLAGELHGGNLGGGWPDYAHNFIVRAEAERLILGREVSPPVTPELLAANREKWTAVLGLLKQGETFARQRQWKEARDAYVQALDHPGFIWAPAENESQAGCLALQIGVALVQTGDSLNHKRLARLLLALDGGTPAPIMADRYAKTCLLNWKVLPPDVRQRAVELARYAVTLEKMAARSSSWWASHTAGMAEYYAGDYLRALELLRHAENSDDPQGGRIACRGGAMIFRAMALRQLGRAEEAREVLARAEALLAEPVRTRSDAAWWDLDICEIALKEARELLGETARKQQSK